MNEGQGRETYQEALGLYQQGRYEDALRLLDQLEEQNPGNPDVMFGRAQCMAQLGRRQEALAIAGDLSMFHSDPRGEQLTKALGQQGPGADPLGLGDSPASGPPPVPPQRRGGGAKWIIGAVVAVVVIGVSTGMAIVLRGGNGGAETPGGETLTLNELTSRIDAAYSEMGSATIHLTASGTKDMALGENGKLTYEAAATLDIVMGDPPKMRAEGTAQVKASGIQGVNLDMPIEALFIKGPSGGGVVWTMAGQQLAMPGAGQNILPGMRTDGLEPALREMRAEGLEPALGRDSSVGGTPHYTIVITGGEPAAADSQTKITLHIAKSTLYVDRIDFVDANTTTQIELTYADIGKDFPGEVFEFTPPPEAQVVDSSQLGQMMGGMPFGGMQGGF